MIQPIKQDISFGYRSVLKTEWLAGHLPTVKKDVYGQVLKDVTVEHLIAKSKGGKSQLFNYGLANKLANNQRGNKPLMWFTTKENLIEWFTQFVGVKTEKFDGDKYIENASKYLKKHGIDIWG